MSKNPFRQVRDGVQNGVMSEGQKEEEPIQKEDVGGVKNERNGNGGRFESISEEYGQPDRYVDLVDSVELYVGKTNGVHSQHAGDGSAVQTPAQQPGSTRDSNGLGAQGYDKDLNSLSGAVQGIQIDQVRQDETQRGHAHVPSFSHIRKASLPQARPTYVRAPSTQITEVQRTQLTPEEARAEVIRRLGKVDRSSKTLKRRGSNESLSSLISYSIRRPSIPARPESGYSLDALASVLEDAAQEGNLPLVEATISLGANPNFRSVNRLKNRRHDALNKAIAAGHIDIIDFLVRHGATFGSNDTLKKDPIPPVDRKLLDVAYSGYADVAQYLITKHAANPFVQHWPREYSDATRTIYRRVQPVKTHQRSVLDALSRIGDPAHNSSLLNHIMSLPQFNPSAICTRVYIDTPYQGDGTRMTQTTYHYSVLAAFVRAGWADAVQAMLRIQSETAGYEILDIVTKEEGQIPSTLIQRYVWPANALTKDTWLYHPVAALRTLKVLAEHGFDLATPQKGIDDSAPRSPLARAILADAGQAVDVILGHKSELVHEHVSFRILTTKSNTSQELEISAPPLVAAIILDALACAKVMLQHGVMPTDAAGGVGGYVNVLCFAAGHGGASAGAVLGELVGLMDAREVGSMDEGEEKGKDMEVVGQAVQIAIQKSRPDALRILLSSNIARNHGLREWKVWDWVLGVGGVDRDGDVAGRYVRVIEHVYDFCGKGEVVGPSEEVVRRAVEEGNKIGVEKLVALGVIDGKRL
ncbi:hypothetical protein FB567DRAFT_523511 [Paraphoma chrysanthemicola]|uniref:Ankyrin n=1 Tax=Paraphoma chrysanthemicola TaxID=798071 RepID=A0A8K0R6G3_9PLEO|nr:hypothetical protein FB567DRAFT_523511 [Paraphoma chrysanthemicola]